LVINIQSIHDARSEKHQNLELSEHFRCHLLVCLSEDTGQMGERYRQVIQTPHILHDWPIWDQWNPLWNSFVLYATMGFPQRRLQAMLCVRVGLTW